jgi:hypothetical protein
MENFEKPKTNILTEEERQAIFARADLREMSQKLKVDALNLSFAENLGERKEYYEETLSTINREADGNETIDLKTAKKIIEEKGEETKQRAQLMEKVAPNLSYFLYANLAKIEQAAGSNFQDSVDSAKESSEKSKDIPKFSPSAILPDAILIGTQKRTVAKTELPAINKVAQEVLTNEKLLESYALVLDESQREEFLKQLPEDQRRRVSIILDSAVSRTLHQSLVEKKTPEEDQRRAVRLRLFKELRTAIENPKTTEKKLVKMLGKSFAEMGEDSRQLLLEIIRDEFESRQGEDAEKEDYLPRIMKVMVDNFDDLRANDIILQTASDSRLNHHLSIFLFKKLIEKKYISEDVGEWWQENRKNEKPSLEILQRVVSDLGVVPSRQILDFISEDSRWKEGRKVLDLNGRIEKIKSSQEEFAGIENNIELAKILHQDENKAIVYYLLYGGQDRFNLINNYDFAKFSEMVGLISGDEHYAREKNLTPLRAHEKPIRQFKQSLLGSGISESKANEIIESLRNGHFPLKNQEQARQEVSFDVDENAALEIANRELGKVLGKEQLGVILRFPLYREYLEKENSKESKKLIEEIQESTTFSQRFGLLEKIDKQFPDFKEQVKTDLQKNWLKFGEKMLIEMTLDQVMENPVVSVRGEDILPRLDAKRIDLKRIKKDLLVLLKGENKAIGDVGREISKKKKARAGLLEGLEHQADEKGKANIEERIKSIDKDIEDLEKRRALLGEAKVDERFSHLTLEEKKEEIDKLSQEVIALTEKSPSAIFTYITMQVLGEERLRESDVGLIKEMESHLQAPFQQISDFKTYERPKQGAKRQNIVLEYLDKTKRMMNMVRFADSKICCFSSSNYEMRVQHDTPNKFWVASINADPISFVISMEIPQTETEEAKTKAIENIGFIFGSYGIAEKGKLAIMLNGIYYAPGIESKEQVKAIMDAVEKIFSNLPIETIVIGSQYGGSSVGENIPKEFSNSAVELTRLRALDDGGGSPETTIYDDLNTNKDLNRPHDYSGNIWHKKISAKIEK